MTRCLILLSIAAAAAAAAADLQRGRQTYVICEACHGPQARGEARLGSPSLAGQQEKYLLRQLDNFKSGKRGGKGDPAANEMREILETVSDERDWKDVTAYIRSFAVVPAQKLNDGESAEGRRVYAACAPCHGDDAQGNESLDAPNLRSLPAWYIVTELQKFRSEIRGAAPDDQQGAVMRAAAATLQSDSDINAVATFISGH